MASDIVRKLSFTFLLLLLYVAAFSQSGDLRGTVFNADDGTSLENVVVRLSGTKLQAASDKNGIYNFGKVKAANYKLVAEAGGFELYEQSITVKPDKANNVTIYLKPQIKTMDGVDVNTKRGQKKDSNKVDIGVIKIDPKKEFPRLPSVGGEPDLVQYLQILPGVVSSGDQGGQLYIRGGSPVMNKMLLDGMTIYNPFHSIGLFSVFDGDIMKDIEVHSAAFNVQYGGRIGAVVDVTTRDGNKKNFAGKASAGPFVAKVIFEGPLKKYKPGEGSSSFLVSYRNSYLNTSAPKLYPYAIKEQGSLPYSFQDFFGKLNITAAGGSKLNFSTFKFSDRVSFPASTNFAWDSWGGNFNFLMLPEGSSSIINGVIGYSSYNMKQLESDQKPRYSSINGFNATINFTYFFSADEFKYGIETNGFATDFSTYNSSDRLIQQVNFSTELCLYTKYKRRWKKFLLEPGLRMQYYATLGNASFEPRFQGKYDITSYMRLKFAAGRYSQNLMSAVSDRDVVNLFYGFLSSPEDLPKTFDGKPVASRLQKSDHLLIGWDMDLNRRSNLSIEAYRKNFGQLTNINRDKIYDNNEKNQDKPEQLRMDYIIENGYAQGLDFKYVWENKHWYFWSVYSLTYITRYDGIRTYFPTFDRRHNINLLLSYKHQTNTNRLLFNVRWNLGSGFPFTQTQGFYEKVDFTNGISSNYATANGTLGIQYAQIGGGRLPWYHRLDISIDWRHNMKRQQYLNINLGCTNVYDRKNIFYFDRVKYQRVNQLPILPTLSVAFGW